MSDLPQRSDGILSITNAAKERPDINKVLADITGALVGKFNIATLLEQVVETSMRTLHAEVCSVFLTDREKDPHVLTMMAGSGYAGKLVGKSRYHIGEGLTGTIAKYGSKFNIKNRDEFENLTVGGQKYGLVSSTECNGRAAKANSEIALRFLSRSRTRFLA